MYILKCMFMCIYRFTYRGDKLIREKTKFAV